MWICVSTTELVIVAHNMWLRLQKICCGIYDGCCTGYVGVVGPDIWWWLHMINGDGCDRYWVMVAQDFFFLQDI